MARNSSRIHEKIQIHFEINFLSLTVIVMLLGSNNNYYVQLKSDLKTDKW